MIIPVSYSRLCSEGETCSASVKDSRLGFAPWSPSARDWAKWLSMTFATSTKLLSWEAVQIPKRLRFLSRLAILLVGLFLLIVAFVPWTQTITVTGQLSAYTPFDRPQDIEAQITGRIKKWHIFEGVRVKAGDVILELDDYDPNFMAPISSACSNSARKRWKTPERPR